MAVCPRCSAQNPDGNRFCQNCGQPLAAGPVATAPPPGAPTPPQPAPQPAPAPPPGAYQSPYYSPAVPQKVHRTPWLLIIGVVVVLVLVMGSCGAAIAFVGGHKTNNSQSTPKLGTPAPPQTSASPTQGSPSPQPTQVAGQTISIAALTVTVPAGFKLESKSDTQVTASTPKDDGVIQVQSQKMSAPATDQQLQQQVLAYFKSKYPDANVCASSDGVALNGPAGSITKICYTLTQQNSTSVAAAAVYWIATNAAHTVYYEVDGVTGADNFDAFMEATSPFVDSVTWKLT